MDREVGFTKGDGTREGPLRGNANLRRQVKLSKSTLGYCAPLALQTNGKSRTRETVRGDGDGHRHNGLLSLSLLRKRERENQAPLFS
jgi:hypothetical protein